MKLSQVEALLILIRDARADRTSRSSYNRVVRALNAFGLNDEDRLAILLDMDYTDDKGNVYQRFIRSQSDGEVNG
jgi:hypothetical protein